MKTKWNVDPEDKSTYARLLSELEGASYLIDAIGDEKDYATIRGLCTKYYGLYFKAKP